jgi:hypothetical protein
MPNRRIDKVMMPLQPNNPQIIYSFEHFSIEGMRQEKLVSHSKISEFVDKTLPFLTDLNQNLSENEKEKIKNHLKILTIEKAKELSDKDPEEYSWVRKTSDCYFGNQKKANKEFSKRIRYNYERDEKKFENDNSRDEWKPRIKIIEESYACPEILSISIVPFNPNTRQTLFDTKYVSHLEIIEKNSKKIKELLNYMPDVDQLFEDQHREFRSITSNKKKDPNKFPESNLVGFFLPYCNFSSNIAFAQFDPENLPSSANKAFVFSEKEVEKNISEIKSFDLKNRIRSIVSLFIDDSHAKSLSLIILHPHPKRKMLFYTKEDF